MPPNTLTVAEAAEALGVSAGRVRVLIREGRLRARRFGPAWLIDRRSLSAVAVRTPWRPRRERQSLIRAIRPAPDPAPVAGEGLGLTPEATRRDPG